MNAEVMAFSHFSFLSFLWKCIGFYLNHQDSTIALKKIGCPKTGAKRKVLRQFCDEVNFQECRKSWNSTCATFSKTRSCESPREKFRMVRAPPWTPLDPPNFNLNYGFPTFYIMFSFLQFLLYVSLFVGPIGPVFCSIGPLWHRLAPTRQCETRRSRRHGRRLREPQAQHALPEWPKKEVGRDRDSIGIPTPTQPSPPKNIKLSHMGFGKVLTRQKYAENMVRDFLPPVSRNLATGSIRKLDFHDVGVAGESHFITEWSQILPFCLRHREHKLLFLILTSSSNHLENV